MQRLLLLILCLCSMWAAQAQVAYDWRYWFDQSPTYEQGSSVGILQLDVDVSGLSKTLHQIHVQVRDTAGMFSEPVTRYFFVPNDGDSEEHKLYYWFDQNTADLQSFDQAKGVFDLDISAQSPGIHSVHFFVTNGNGEKSEPMTRYFYIPEVEQGNVSLCYWYDQNEASLHTTSHVSGLFDLDVSALSPGIHTIHFFTKDESGKSSEPVYRCFVKPDSICSNLMWRYWFDDAITQSVILPGTTASQMIDVESLSDGLHYIHLQAVDASFSETKTQMFIKVPDMQNLTEVNCLVLIDNALFSKETVDMRGGCVANLNLDVEELTQGLHKLDVFVMTPSGVMSKSYNAFFIKENYQDERGAMRCLYTFDNENTVHETTYSEGVSHINIDVAQLEDGLHTVRWMLADKAGAYVSDKRSWFFKTPLGGNTITKYAYWVNDADSIKHESVLDTPKSPYDLIALLPVETMPLRSSCFHFEVRDNQPIMYAKNDIHFTFTDRIDREAEICKQYVDYNVFAEVTDVAELKSTQTFVRPEVNCIKWFKFEALEGDTIIFRANQATTIQVFDPTGKEIYSAMGDKSIVLDGVHTWEDGTHYVAVHDVTGSKPNVTLDYMHMDKYDVVSQDVNIVGNGGCSTITFQGNGFRDLYAVDLKDSRGNIIQSIDIGHESDASTTVTFDFTGAELGKYNAVFHFTEEDKTFSNNITVEDAKAIELLTKVSYPSTFLRGTSVTYTVEITNKGNMTAYSVPVYTYLKNRSRNGISWIEYDVLKTDEMFTIDGMDKDDHHFIYEQIKSLNKDLYFTKLYTMDPESNDSAMIRTNYSFVTIPPRSSLIYNLEITSSDEIEVWVTVSKNWLSFSTDSVYNSKLQRSKRYALAKDYYCCYKEHIECFLEQATTALDVTSLALSVAGILAIAQPEVTLALEVGALETGLAGCLTSLVNDELKHFGTTLCESDKKGLANFLNAAKASSKAPISIPSVVSCLGATLSALGFGTKAIFNVSGSVVEEIGTHLGAAATGLDFVNDDTSCQKSKEKKPNCPPNQGGGGGKSTPVNSLDPNDIYGYVAQSGSKFIGEDVVILPYRIEFENDTTFATASAHTVIVKDTLDATKFDLASYQPTSIRIGDKNVYLNGDKEFVTTVDMRPAINTIAQVEGRYDEKSGIATWQFTSLDPMTMEPTDDIMQGFLPVNYDGSGIGEVAYIINRKTGLPDGTEISNKASIIFDNNDAIETPVWTNIIDAIPPVAHVSEVEQLNDTTMLIRFDGEDYRSGLWKYALYVQYGEETAWFQVAETDTTCVEFRYVEDVDYGFCVVATDSAGNVEQKIIRREYSFLNGEGKLIDNISSARKNQVATNRAYDLNGRLIQEEGYRGIIIKNRKKILKR